MYMDIGVWLYASVKVHSSSAAVRHDNPMCLRTQDMQLAYVVELNNICVRYLEDKMIL